MPRCDSPHGLSGEDARSRETEAPEKARDTRPQPSGALARILESEPEGVGLLARSALALCVARVALRLFSLASLARFAARLAAGALRDAADADAGSRAEIGARLARGVDAASARLGGRCLARSVSLLWLLAHRGIEGRLSVGFPRRGHPLAGHAWVEVDGTPLGSDGAALRSAARARYDVLLRLPEEPGG